MDKKKLRALLDPRKGEKGKKIDYKYHYQMSINQTIKSNTHFIVVKLIYMMYFFCVVFYSIDYELFYFSFSFITDRKACNKTSYSDFFTIVEYDE